MNAAATPRDPAGLKLRDKAYASFTEKLLAGDVRPGQFLSQRELVEMTGLSLGAIRELVPRLEADGLIKTVPQRGMQVAHVDLNLIRNAFQFRLVLEKEAVAHFVATAGDDQIGRLAAAHRDITARAAQGPVTEALVALAQRTDWDLHDSLIDSLDNAILSEAYRVNSIKIRLIRREQTRLDAARVAPVMAEHLRIIEAIERRDAAGAVQAMTEHILGARNRALQI
ncbi:MAG: GntR family transcriptional regulator [Rhizobiales bacterium]|nr:GntR family transcriptional regulator [Hyphomicrobiales bacterium]